MDFISGASLGSQQPQGPADDAESEVASEMGRGSRMSMRYDLGSRAGDEEGGGSGKNTLKGMFKNKNKKSKQIELDALRCGTGILKQADKHLHAGRMYCVVAAAVKPSSSAAAATAAAVAATLAPCTPDRQQSAAALCVMPSLQAILST
jgi:hypothetical protein